MHTLVAVVLVAGAALVGPAPTAHASAPRPGTPIARVQQEPKGERREPHPEIRRAMRQLEAAKASLNKAASDFGGHRVAAIKSIDEALGHLREALAYDKK